MKMQLKMKKSIVDEYEDELAEQVNNVSKEKEKERRRR